MKIDGIRIDKRKTERRIKANTPSGWRFLRVNWSKGLIHFVDPNGHRVFVHLSREPIPSRVV